MRVVVIGGTGLIGSKVTLALRRLGHTVIAASPSMGIDTITGQGLEEAMSGAEVVLDLSNPKDRSSALSFFEVSVRNIISAARSAGIRHYVVLSIVGIDRAPGQLYFLAKQAQEKLLVASDIPFTIARSTQFFEFVETIVEAGADKGVIRIPQGQFQPVAAGDVAAILCYIVLGNADGHIIEIAGPERGKFALIVSRFLAGIGDRRKVVEDNAARYFGGRITDESLVPKGQHIVGHIDLEQWLHCRKRLIPGEGGAS